MKINLLPSTETLLPLPVPVPRGPGVAVRIRLARLQVHRQTRRFQTSFHSIVQHALSNIQAGVAWIRAVLQRIIQQARELRVSIIRAKDWFRALPQRTVDAGLRLKFSAIAWRHRAVATGIQARATLATFPDRSKRAWQQAFIWIGALPGRAWHRADSQAEALADVLNAAALTGATPFIRSYQSSARAAERYWASRWVIHRGFIITMLIVTSVAGSTLWAIVSLPFLPGHPIPEADTAPMMEVSRMVVARPGVPAELAWFFIEFPYASSDARIIQKNRHTFLVVDKTRKRQYVVSYGQTFRRVEIYFSDNKGTSQVRIFTPGHLRTVNFTGARVMSDVTNKDDTNQWMWNGPLWNAMHLKIYGMADFWLDSPYKRNSCAGFVHQFLKDAGVATPVLDAWDIAKLPWTRVPIDEMEPGDIITIRAASAGHRRYWHHSVTHVGVYLGHGKIIHASTPSLKARRSWVRITSVDTFKGRIDKVLRPPSML